MRKRLDWALDQINRLDSERTRKGTLDPDEDALFRRCDRLVKRFKGQQRRQRGETEGVDDVSTFSVLAAEGFLPGYGLEGGSVPAPPRYRASSRAAADIELRRASSLAVREYVPGNLIYANGHRFVPRYYHLLAQLPDPIRFQVDATSEAVERGGKRQFGSIAGDRGAARRSDLRR